jgi:hypothetical protein
MKAFSISVVLIQEGNWWSAQCLEYDIAAQAKTVTDLRYELERVIISHVAVSVKLGREPFEGLERAPQKYWTLFENSKLRIEDEEAFFQSPESSYMPTVMPKLRIADQHVN